MGWIPAGFVQALQQPGPWRAQCLSLLGPVARLFRLFSIQNAEDGASDPLMVVSLDTSLEASVATSAQLHSLRPHPRAYGRWKWLSFPRPRCRSGRPGWPVAVGGSRAQAVVTLALVRKPELHSAGCQGHRNSTSKLRSLPAPCARTRCPGQRSPAPNRIQHRGLVAFFKRGRRRVGKGAQVAKRSPRKAKGSGGEAPHPAGESEDSSPGRARWPPGCLSQGLGDRWQQLERTSKTSPPLTLEPQQGPRPPAFST